MKKMLAIGIINQISTVDFLLIADFYPGPDNSRAPPMRRPYSTLPSAMLCAVALHVAPAHAALHGEVIAYGETTAETERPALPTPEDRSLVARTVIGGIHYVGRASTLSAQLCLRFGVSVRLTTDAGEELPPELMVVVTHPQITRPDGASSTRDSFPTPVVGGTVYAGWTFDHPWEMQPGDWTIAFKAGGVVMASQKFAISVATPAGSVCLGAPTS